MMTKFTQLAFILAFLALGEGLKWVLGVPVPGSIIGMLCLVLCLEFKIVKLNWVKDASDFLIQNMAFFFIPAGVGLMVQWDIIQKEWVPIVVASVLSTLIVMAVTGLVSGRK
ncbi:CidA/LrgA family protein [Halosquirtibacter xylanolyticus]|uniref:CidA/LrgA family protein n=1 Tax=Halosquirtibacter xylanolyticus TaxID=3374599 RepID=UPI0037496786|nr:CidA/LrgA family protein [Prolixibacteraceae bacterium]